MCLYNAYLPGNKQAARLTRNPEDVYREIAEDPIPEGRRYLALLLGGDVLGVDDTSFSMPIIKYYFK